MTEDIGQTAVEPVRFNGLFAEMARAKFIDRLDRIGGGLVKPRSPIRAKV